MFVASGLGNAGIAIVSVASLAAGYVVLWALWHFVFSPRNEHDDVRDHAHADGGNSSARS